MFWDDRVPLRMRRSTGELSDSIPGCMRLTPAVGEQLHLVATQVGLHLVEQAVARAVRDERGKERLEVPRVDDVVDGLEVEGVTASGELGQLPPHPIRGLGTKRHRLAVQPAERAVSLRPPPTPARALEGHVDGSACAARQHTQRLGAVEELLELGDGKLVESIERCRGTRRRHLAVAPAQDAAHCAGIAALGQRNEEIDKCNIGLARDRVVDHGRRPHQLGSHGAVQVGATEHDDETGKPFLQAGGHRDRSDVLREGRGEPHDAVALPGHLLEHQVEVRGDDLVAQLAETPDRRLELVRLGHESGGEVVEKPILRVGSPVAVRREREEPLADRVAAMLRDRLVQSLVHEGRELQVQVGGVAGKPVGSGDGRQQTDLQ